MTCEDIHNVISSPESVDGQPPCDSPDGQTIDMFGQAVAPAKITAAQAKKHANTGSVTYGRIGCGSLESASLTSYLANRLQARLPLDGLTMLPMGWKRKNTPSLRLYYQLVPLAGSIDATDCGLWHTPRAVMIEETPEAFRARMNSKRPNDRKDGLPNLAVQALWATPDCSDDRGMNSKQIGLSNQAKLAMWATPRAQTARGASPHGEGGMGLQEQADFSMWPTPSARDWKDTQGMNKEAINPDGTGRTRQDQLARVIPTLVGCNAQTEKSGQLNPEFVCWLMQYRVAWLFAAPQNRVKSKNIGITEPACSPDSETPFTHQQPQNLSSQQTDGGDA